MNFDNLTDAEIDEFSTNSFLIKKGKCKYTVTKAEPHKSGPNSKNPGSPCIKLSLDVEDDTGKKAKIFDYLPVGAKLIKFLTMHGFQKEIEERRIPEHKLVGLSGDFQNDHEKDNNGELQNKLKFYIVLRETLGTKNDPALQDDDIPF